jgi:homoserine O-acetyltransferase/O-succinyltransferase
MARHSVRERESLPLRLRARSRSLIVIVLIAAALPALAQEVANKLNTNWSGYQEGDYVINDYKFVSAESSPEVTLHYRTIGTAKKNSAGEVVNAVLLLQGNTGTGANWFRPTLADELYKTGQPLDAAKSGASRPASHINSMLRCASRSSRRSTGGG